VEKKSGAVKFLILFACGAVAYFLIQKTFFLLLPISLAYLFSEVIRNSFSRLRPLAPTVKRILTVLLLLIFFGLLSLFAVLLAERLLHYTTLVTELLSENAENIVSFCKEQLRRFESALSPLLGQDPENGFTRYLPGLFQNLLEKVLDLIPGWIGGILGFLPRFFISLIIFIISCYYFSCDWERIRLFSDKKIPSQLHRKLSLLKKHFFLSLKQFSKAYLILFLLNFAILYLGMVLLKSSNAFGTAFLIAFVDLLPILGCGTVLIPWAIFSFLLGNIGAGVGLIVLYLVTLFAHQMAEPKIVGTSIGLHPILSLVLVLLGLKTFGIWGMILLPLGFTAYQKTQEELEKPHGN